MSELPDWIVGRPAEVTQVVSALTSGRGKTVGITTALQGVGGFGKTTLAQMVCADRRVRKHFGGRVYAVAIGRDVHSAAAIAAKVNDVIRLVAHEECAFTDPELAGQRLGALLDLGPRILLVLDDVWEQQQLAPFTLGGRQCARLVTTRIPSLVAGHSIAIPVDQMSPEQARRLLTYKLPPLDRTTTENLLAVTGRWPLLLRLANKILGSEANSQNVSVAADALAERLRASGPAAADDILGVTSVDMNQRSQRARAVRATIEASTSLLTLEDAQRFTELAVFAEDEVIPFRLLTLLWHATAGLSELEAIQVRERLADLALVTLSSGNTEPGGLVIHDVIRDFLRAELDPSKLAELHAVLIDAFARSLPAGMPYAESDGQAEVTWWELRDADGYMWDHLIEHLIDAGRPDDAERIAGDLRWVAARLTRLGPAAPTADLSRIATPQASQLAHKLAQAAHLLAPTEPTEAVVDVLYSRVANVPYWSDQVSILQSQCNRPRLVSRLPIPDVHPAFRRALTVDNCVLTAAAIAPDSTWLATTGTNGTVQIWDTATWMMKATFSGSSKAVATATVSPDGTWLATVTEGGAVQIWDTATWRPKTSLATRRRGLRVTTVAPDWTWFATIGDRDTIGDNEYLQIWDATTSTVKLTFHTRRSLVIAATMASNGTWLAVFGARGEAQIWSTTTGAIKNIPHTRSSVIRATAVAPDGSWLAAFGSQAEVEIWDTATWRRKIIRRTRGIVRATVVAPDGTWLASTDDRGKVEIWDTRTWVPTRTLPTFHEPKNAAVVAPDGTWLATVGERGETQIWDPTIWKRRTVLATWSRTLRVAAAAADSSWLATIGERGEAQIWDLRVDVGQDSFTRHNWMLPSATAPDSRWLATIGYQGEVRIWDTTTWTPTITLPTRHTSVRTAAVAPDGTWLATGDEEVQIWDTATWTPTITLPTRHNSVRATAVSQNGNWMATIGNGEEVQIWDTATWTPTITLPTRYNSLPAVAVAPDGTWLAIVSDFGQVQIWETVTWTRRAIVGASSADGGDPSDDAPWLATRGNRRQAQVKDGTTRTSTTTLPAPNHPKCPAAVAPDGTWLATAGDRRRVQIWDTATWTSTITLAPASDLICTALVAPDGTWMATVGDRGQVEVWDPAGWTLTISFPTRHSVVTASVSPDSTRLATIGRNGEVQIWDIRTGKVRAMMRVDDDISVCTWAGLHGLVFSGRSGLYAFDFVTGPLPPGIGIHKPGNIAPPQAS